MGGVILAKIKQLSAILSNKIAAGEVVERPASVVKELVENAIDAGSTKIEIYLQEAGLQSIEIIDNGEGMDAEDAVLAFGRHATSKIVEDYDLFHIKTLGFRGEALASIASVSKVTLETCADQHQGITLYLEGGELKSNEVSHARKGTRIKVEQLFYNTPARLKYVKTLATELGNITDIINRLALGYPNISFKLANEHKTLLQTSGNGNIQQVLAVIYSPQIARNMLKIVGANDDYEIEGYISLPEETRANRHYMSIFINGRYIKNIGITKAIQEGYNQLLPIHRFPIAYINIKMDAILVDVNVHPTKQEVRLSKEKELQQLLMQTIREVLKNYDYIADAQTVIEKKKPVLMTEQQDLFEIVSHDEAILHQVDDETETTIDIKHYETITNQNNEAVELPMTSTNIYQEPFAYQQPDIIKEQSEVVQRHNLPLLEVIGQLHKTYIVAQGDKGLYLIDQHAAQERIKFEYYREKLAHPPKDVQSLLLPITYHVAQDDYLRLMELLPQLHEVGVFLESFGVNTLVVKEYPTWMPAQEAEQFIRDMIEYLLEHQKVDIKKLREDSAIMMSCKRSIKANKYLQKYEMEDLLAQLNQCIEPYTCPHGRPIIVNFSNYDLEKMFKRSM